MALQLCSFDTMLRRDAEIPRRTALREELIHLVSLLHGLAMMKLRGDDDLGNLHTHIPGDAHDAEGDMHYSRRVAFPRPWKGPLVRVVGSTRELWTGCHSWLRKAYFRLDADTYDHHRRNPIRVIGGLSDGEREALGGVDERVYLVMQWLVDVVVALGKAQAFEVEPPIVSRVYQELSDGMLGYNHARKIAEIPFPFPYAQTIAVLLVVHTVLVPVVVNMWVESYVASSLVTLIAVWSYFAINEVNRDLEDPYLFEPNDLPLTTFQLDLNYRLVSLGATVRESRLASFNARFSRALQGGQMCDGDVEQELGTKSALAVSGVGGVSVGSGGDTAAQRHRQRKSHQDQQPRAVVGFDVEQGSTTES